MKKFWCCSACRNFLSFGSRRCGKCGYRYHYQCTIEQFFWNKPTRIVCRPCYAEYKRQMIMVELSFRVVRTKTQELVTLLNDNLNIINRL